MKLNELKMLIDDPLAKEYGNPNVVFRDDRIDPELDIASAYFDAETDSFILCGYGS